jgi:hypothetical protein
MNLTSMPRWTKCSASPAAVSVDGQTGGALSAFDATCTATSAHLYPTAGGAGLTDWTPVHRLLTVDGDVPDDMEFAGA